MRLHFEPNLIKTPLPSHNKDQIVRGGEKKDFNDWAWERPYVPHVHSKDEEVPGISCVMSIASFAICSLPLFQYFWTIYFTTTSFSHIINMYNLIIGISSYTLFVNFDIMIENHL